MSVTVTCVDDPPTAVNDTPTLPEDSAATPLDVLANDNDPDGGPRTIASVTQPANGTVVITGSGTGLTYQPDPGYCNSPPGTTPDTFTYTLTGGSTATVSVTGHVRRRRADRGRRHRDGHRGRARGRDQCAFQRHGHRRRPDDDRFGPTDPANGTVVLTGGSAGAHTGLTYQPDANYCNTQPGGTPDTFTYTLNGGSQATVSVTVTCVDDPPLAEDDEATVNVNTGSVGIDVLHNESDIDNGPRSIASFTQPTHGSVSGTGPSGAWSSLTYQLTAGYCDNAPPTSSDSFGYTINGGSSATVTITIDCTNPPDALSDSATVPLNAGTTPIPVLANDGNSDGGPMMIVDNTTPANGTVVLMGGGSGLSYKPNSGYCNTPNGPTDNFTYTLNGGDSATVAVTVTCPTAVPQQETLRHPQRPSARRARRGSRGSVARRSAGASRAA